MPYRPCLAIVLVALVGCANNEGPMPQRRQAHHPQDGDCPPPSVLADDTGWGAAPRAMYRAQRHGDSVVVHAEGEHPTAGWKILFAQKSASELALRSKPPEGISAQVMTPFSICARIPAAGVGDRVTVIDATGAVAVPVR
jgi:hypothetical protein